MRSGQNAYPVIDIDNAVTVCPVFSGMLHGLTNRPQGLFIHPGAIVLLHSTSQTNADILDELLTKWEDMGYTFGTLDELSA